MFSIKTLLTTALLAVSSVSAHMHLEYPKPINYDTDLQNYDWWVNENTFPCRGQLKDLDIAAVEAVWSAGSTQSFRLGGSSPHWGGSSQISLSYDQGKTFRVIKSFPGSCPHREQSQGQEFSVTIPEEAPAGEVIFSWSWFNREGEMYHNCALIEIENSKGSGSLDHLPEMLVANVNNGCTTPRTTAEVAFPNPGPDVESGDGAYPLVEPQGNCV